MAVEGFIPPAAFMEFQARGYLPISSPIRTAAHLGYTPAPDIIHEAAGHAPMLCHQEYAEYLRQYATVAHKAMVTHEDMRMYDVIRRISDGKEDPRVPPSDIENLERELQELSDSITSPSEAAKLSRINWWTVEYGLIGTLGQPKVYGAGLLSSVYEAEYALSDAVTKIPYSLDCVNYTYDITRPQPQLFVTESFQKLIDVLDEFASTMAYTYGGVRALAQAQSGQTVNTVVLGSGIEISGIVSAFRTKEQAPSETAYLQLQGPSQLSYQGREIPGHGTTHHADGYGTVVGDLVAYPGRCPSRLSPQEWHDLGAVPGQPITWKWTSGVVASGTFQGAYDVDGNRLIVSLENAWVRHGDDVLFRPEWGVYDLALGQDVVSVYGGPADRVAYTDSSMEDFSVRRVGVPSYTSEEKRRHSLYERAAESRRNGAAPVADALWEEARRDFSDDWLLFLEVYECAQTLGNKPLLARMDSAITTFSEDAQSYIKSGIASAYIQARACVH